MDTASLLETFGYFFIFASVFIECGLLLGLFLPLPGFSLLFTAGVFAAAEKMDIYAIITVGTAAAIAGYIAGYYTGSKYGRKIFYEKETKKYFTPAQGRATEKFMAKYGYLTLIVGRFLPVMHNVAPLMSGVAKTPIVPFMVLNIIGGLAWTVAASASGYFIGQVVPHAQYLTIPFIILIVVAANLRPVKRYFRELTAKIEKM